MRPFARPLTVRDCADYLGFTTEWIRRAITEGVTNDGVLVKLEAEALTLNGRCVRRVHQDKFREFLLAIGWKHLPGRRSTDMAERRFDVPESAAAAKRRLA